MSVVRPLPTRNLRWGHSRGSPTHASAAHAREIGVPGADDHRPAAYVVAHRHRPGRDARERAVAAVLGEPARAANGCLALAAMCAEAASTVAAPQPADAPDRGCARHAAVGRAPAAAREVAAAQEERRHSAAAAGLPHLELRAPELPRLKAAVRCDAGDE